MASNRGIGVPRRLLTAAAMAACGLFMSAAGVAADTIGQTQNGNSCNGGPGMDTVQIASAAAGYAVPAGDWNITDWSTEASPDQSGNLALEVWRPTATAGSYVLVGISPAQPVLAGSPLNSFHLDAAIPVQAGDLLGLRVEGVAGCRLTFQSGDAFAEAPNTSTPAPNDTRDFPFTLHGWVLSVAATLTPAAPPPPPTPTSASDCKDGGWQTFTDGTGTPFKNQGDCVSFLMTGGQNPAGG